MKALFAYPTVCPFDRADITYHVVLTAIVTAVVTGWLVWFLVTR